MSIVAYYAKIDRRDLDEILLKPEALYTEKFEVIDIDRSWDPMTWILSKYKRTEHSYNSLVIKWMREKQNKEKDVQQGFLGRLFSKKKNSNDGKDVLYEEKQKLKALEPDILLIGIEGRGENRVGNEDFALGDACLLENEELGDVVQALSNVEIHAIDLDFKLMDEEEVFPGNWVNEGEDLFETYIVSNFEKLKKFYTEALNTNKCILIWYS